MTKNSDRLRPNGLAWNSSGLKKKFCSYRVKPTFHQSIMRYHPGLGFGGGALARNPFLNGYSGRKRCFLGTCARLSEAVAVTRGAGSGSSGSSHLGTDPLGLNCGLCYATSNKCIATSNRCLTSSNKKLLELKLLVSLLRS